MPIDSVSQSMPIVRSDLPFFEAARTVSVAGQDQSVFSADTSARAAQIFEIVRCRWQAPAVLGRYAGLGCLFIDIYLDADIQRPSSAGRCIEAFRRLQTVDGVHPVKVLGDQHVFYCSAGAR